MTADTRDEVAAQRFGRRRLRAALVQGDPDSPVAPLSRLGAGVYGGLAITVLLLAGSLLRLCAALEQRGHAALETLHVGTEAAGSAALDAITELVANLSPARSYPHWELSAKAKPDADPRRVRLVERVAQQLRRALAANGAAWTGQPHG